ncbi:MAG: type II secretory pathway component HofQ [Myxococcota bacterium]|jgi:type II secretory pathway component HofQ
MFTLLAALTASATPPAVQHLDGGGVLIRLGGEVVPAAQAAAPPPPLPNTHRTISLDLQDADIHNVLRLFAEVSGLNFVASDDVQGKVTVVMNDVPWDAALMAILHSKGLGAQRLGDQILTIDTRAAP